MKFGGSSVGTADAISQVVGLVGRFREVRPVLVVSALQGVTDELLALAAAAADGRSVAVTMGLEKLRQRHHAVADGCVGSDATCHACIDQLMDALTEKLAEVAKKHGHDDRDLDAVVSFGERLSAPIVAASLIAHDIPSKDLDSREMVVTDERFGSANVRFAESDARIASAVRPHVEGGAVPVITGFIGATEKGETTTLGRGGSDYSVSIIAGALDAEEIWIWKEVDGVLTADPRIVPEAALISAISYDEAAELSHFGAKVLHPKTMIPAVLKKIPVRMRNTFRPDAPGTVIGDSSQPTVSGVKAVSAMRRLTMVTVEGKGMSGMAGFAAHVFGIAGKHGINVVMFSQSSSEQNICLIADAKDGRRFKEALEAELAAEMSLRVVDAVKITENVAAVAIIGEGMHEVSGVAARLFRAVASVGVSVRSIASGSSERSVSFVVDDQNADDVVRAVHASFALHVPASETVAAAAGAPLS